MILVIIQMKVLPEKHKELSQTIVSLIGSLRTEKGCRRCDFCRSMEDENELRIIEEWDTRENLNSHLKSEGFRVLRGAMNLLQEPYEMMVHTVAARKQMNANAVPNSSLMPGMTGANAPSVKPNSDRSNIMKSGTRDEAEGKFHKVKGKIKEIAGKVTMNPDLEAEGKAESITGKVQEKIGEIKKVVEK